MATLDVGPCFLPCLRQILLFVVAYTRLDGLQSSGNSFVSTSHVTIGKTQLQVHTMGPSFDGGIPTKVCTLAGPELYPVNQLPIQPVAAILED